MRKHGIPIGLSLAAACILVAGMFSASCVNTPTVPMPPPDSAQFSVTAPDADGIAHITGLAGAFPEWSGAENRIYGFVLNLDTDRGVIEPVNMDGSFEAWIEALTGDQLSIQTWGGGGDASIPSYVFVP